MLRTLLCLAVTGLAVNAAEFEVASIKPSDPSKPQTSSGMYSGHGRIAGTNLSLKGYVMRAYGLGRNEVAGGPEWADRDTYDIEARAEVPTDDGAELMRMLQGLLADRFSLAVHRENRLTQAYTLTVAKGGPKLGKSVAAEAVTNYGQGRIEARKITMDGLAERLGRMLDFPVLNRTGIDGAYDLTLEWSPDETKPDDRPSLFTAVGKLGLRLEAQKTNVEILVIDHAERPSEN
jgi:uncharacterized protein (TIGR03435 family)